MAGSKTLRTREDYLRAALEVLGEVSLGISSLAFGAGLLLTNPLPNHPLVSGVLVAGLLSLGALALDGASEAHRNKRDARAAAANAKSPSANPLSL